MEEMIAAQAGLPNTIAAKLDQADAIGDQVAQIAGERAPIVATGCGTAGHAAQGVAAILNEALVELGHSGGAIQWRPPFEACVVPWRGGMCIGVSEGGRSKATVAALEGARAVGGTTALITAYANTPAERAADMVLDTGTADRSWCHTSRIPGPDRCWSSCGRQNPRNSI